MVGVFAQNDGSFKPVASIPVNKGGTWQNAQEVWAKDNGVWVKIFPAEVREPATGDNYQRFSFAWDELTNIGRLIVWWNGVDVYDGYPPAGAVSITLGAWTYYKGALGGTINANRRDYRIYRIGTP